MSKNVFFSFHTRIIWHIHETVLNIPHLSFSIFPLPLFVIGNYLSFVDIVVIIIYEILIELFSLLLQINVNDSIFNYYLINRTDDGDLYNDDLFFDVRGLSQN